MLIETIAAPHTAQIDWTDLTRRYMNPGELEILVGMIESIAPKVVIEMGVNEGRTAQAFLARKNPIKRYIGIDVPRSYKPALAVQSREVPGLPGHLAAADERFELMLKPHGTLDLTAADLPVADAVFIDADHSWRGVLNDSMLALSVVRPGGLILWHDYHANGTVDVREVLQCLAKAPGMRIEHIAATWLCVHRKAPA